MQQVVVVNNRAYNPETGQAIGYRPGETSTPGSSNLPPTIDVRTQEQKQAQYRKDLTRSISERQVGEAEKNKLARTEAVRELITNRPDLYNQLSTTERRELISGTAIERVQEGSKGTIAVRYKPSDVSPQQPRQVEFVAKPVEVPKPEQKGFFTRAEEAVERVARYPPESHARSKEKAYANFREGLTPEQIVLMEKVESKRFSLSPKVSGTIVSAASYLFPPTGIPRIGLNVVALGERLTMAEQKEGVTGLWHVVKEEPLNVAGIASLGVFKAFEKPIASALSFVAKKVAPGFVGATKVETYVVGKERYPEFYFKGLKLTPTEESAVKQYDIIAKSKVTIKTPFGDKVYNPITSGRFDVIPTSNIQQENIIFKDIKLPIGNIDNISYYEKFNIKIPTNVEGLYYSEGKYVTTLNKDKLLSTVKSLIKQDERLQEYSSTIGQGLSISGKDINSLTKEELLNFLRTSNVVKIKDVTKEIPVKLSPWEYAKELEQRGKLAIEYSDFIENPAINAQIFLHPKYKPLLTISTKLAGKEATPFFKDVISHEMVHYKTPQFILQLGKKLPYELQPAELLAFNLSQRFVKSGFKSEIRTIKAGTKIETPLKTEKMTFSDYVYGGRSRQIELPEDRTLSFSATTILEKGRKPTFEGSIELFYGLKAKKPGQIIEITEVGQPSKGFKLDELKPEPTFKNVKPTGEGNMFQLLKQKQLPLKITEAIQEPQVQLARASAIKEVEQSLIGFSEKVASKSYVAGSLLLQPQTKVGQQNLQLQLPRVEQFSLTKQKTQQIQQQKQEQKQVVEQQRQMERVQERVQEQNQRQEQKQEQQQKQMQKQMQRQEQKQQQRSMLKIPMPKIKVPLIKKGEFNVGFTLAKKLKKSKGFQAFIKTKGVFKKVGRVTSKGEAIRFGEKIARHTLSATFKVREAKGEVFAPQTEYQPSQKYFRGYKISGGQRIPLMNEWIQKRGTRLGTLGEVGEIMKAKRTSQSLFNFGGKL